MVNYNRLGRLMQIAIKQRNEHQPKRRKVKERSYKVMKKFVIDYMKAVVREVSENPVCHPFYCEGISHVQVLQKESQKGYAWDMLYNMRDFEIVMHNKYPHAKITFTEPMKELLLERARNGEVYMTEISEHNRNLVDSVNNLRRVVR